ncbi:TPA: Rha family transcriptional regulator [Streptococcus suis]|nr:Rha family transcriptional regulator [Streptococcus suis]NQJ53801.1 Rha family transcriptional regulator [Streptococcus suis]NQL99853.1 Rha family transcriptional regulator [Streptococcus suis]HEM4283926.1 Rha family transcriptional regulator [Streptococcus suis]HEM4387468.1 Rha family transcriptional regulator [Streptococcus suis]
MELGIILKNDELVVDSLTVAEVFEKEHHRILKDIRKIEEYFDTANFSQLKSEPAEFSQDNFDSAEFSQSNFGPADFEDYFYLETYRDKQGKERPVYYMNQKGFTLLVMGYTGQRAFSYKVAYIEQFEEMKRSLQGQNREEMTQAQLLAYIKHYLAGSRVIIQPKDEEMYLDYYCVGIYSLLRYYGFKKSIPCSYIRELRPKVMEIGLAGFEEIVNYCAVKNKLKLAYVKATAQDFQASEVDQAQPPLFSILGLLDHKEEVAT